MVRVAAFVPSPPVPRALDFANGARRDCHFWRCQKWRGRTRRLRGSKDWKCHVDRVDERTLYWPTSPSAFELQRLAHGHTEGGYFYSANRFCTSEHGGTHLDAPVHFGEGQWAAADIPAERLVAPAVVIDVRAQAAADPDYRLTLVTY
jgi:hypothetical protein